MNLTHQGRPKEFYLEKNKDKFAPYWDKIRYIKVTDANKLHYSKDNIWPLEHYQRDSLLQGLIDADPDDLIIISDLDEIINPETIVQIKKDEINFNLFKPFGFVKERMGVHPRQMFHKGKYILKHLNYYFTSMKNNSLANLLDGCAVVCEQEMFMYYVNYKKTSNWDAPILILYKNCQKMTFTQWRALRNILPSIRSGWHFSYMGGIKKIKDKINSIAEGELNPLSRIAEDEKDKFLEDALDTGEIWWENNEKLNWCDINSLDIPALKWFITQYPAYYRKRVRNN